MKYVPKKLCALITGIDQMIIFEEMCVCGWGGGGGGGEGGVGLLLQLQQTFA